MDAWVLGLAASVGARVMRVGSLSVWGERGCGDGGKEEGGFGIRVGILDERKSPSATSFALQTCVCLPMRGRRRRVSVGVWGVCGE